MTVQRTGASNGGTFSPSSEGGIHHRNGESAQSSVSARLITGDRVAVNLLGDGYLEAIDSRDIEQNAQQQRKANLGVAGVVVSAPVLEVTASPIKMQVGRFGWKSQHSTLTSSCADSLRNELGIRNRLYPDEYPTHAASDNPTPFDTPDVNTHKTELERLVDEIRHTSPPGRDPNLAASPDAQTGEKLFAKIGCALCHVPTYKTLPPGTRINGGTYKVPKFLGNTTIHPYSDFLLHDVGTGDGIPQAAKPEYLDQSTANKFRTPPLWGLRFRYGLMHDGNSPGTEAAIVSLFAKPARNGAQTRFSVVGSQLYTPHAFRYCPHNLFLA
ncbi:MAG: di-heme oxidoredictase family protein [Candidatus Sulfotelmatobacter sp.]